MPKPSLNSLTGTKPSLGSFVKRTLPEGIDPLEFETIKRMREVTESGEGTAAQKFARGAITSRYRRLEEPKSRLERGVEKAGAIGKFVGTAGAGILGSLVGATGLFGAPGKEGADRGSAIFAGAAETSLSLVEEGYQNLVGRQDDLPVAGAIKPIKRGAETVALSYTIDKTLNVVGRGGKKIKQFVSRRGPISNSDLGKFYSKAGKQTRETLESLYKNPIDGARKVDLDATDILRKSKDKWGKWRFNGDLKMGEQIDQIYKESLEPTLKTSKEVFRKKDILEIIESNRGKVGDDKITDTAIKYVRENFADKIKPLELYQLKKEAFDGAFTKAGKLKVSINSASGSEIGWASLSQLKKIDGTKEALREMQERYAWKLAVIDNGLILKKEMASRSIGDIIASGSRVGAGATAALWNPMLGLLGAGSQLPQFFSKVAGPVTKKFAQEAGKEGAEKFGKRAVTRQIIKSPIQSLIGK